MNEKKVNRSALLQVRLTPKELERIRNKFSKSTCRKLSDFVRKVLLDKPITINNRNQSLDDFMTEMIKLRNELNAIGNNINQSVRKLHTLSQFQELKSWLTLNENHQKILAEKTDEIKSKINQINDKWLQS